MGAITKFEDLIAWQEARKLAARIHSILREGSFARDYSFRDQLWRACLSVPSNIAEGFERFRPKEFAHYLSIAKASCGEVRSGLYTAYDVGHIDQKTLKALLSQAAHCSRIIGKLRAAVVARDRARRPLSTQHSAPST
jgi:four helix bundle protein